MAKAGVIRARKDGGCSLCRASEANVGKKRCCHILDNAAIAVRHEKGVNFIDISGDVDNKEISFSMKASEKTIKNYIASLSDGLSKKEKEEILSVIRDM
jgi:hypothetical protein